MTNEEEHVILSSRLDRMEDDISQIKDLLSQVKGAIHLILWTGGTISVVLTLFFTAIDPVTRFFGGTGSTPHH